MNAATRSRLSEREFIPDSVDVDVACEGVHAAAAIETGFQPFEPQDAVRNRRVRPASPRQSDGGATLEHRAHGPTRADLPRDPMQSERCAIGVRKLSGAEA